MLFAVLLVVMAMNGTIYRATTVTLPVYFEESATSIVAWFDQLDLPGVGAAAGASTLGAGLLVSLACLLGVIGQSLGGRAADRFDLRAAYLTFFCLALPALLAMIALEGIALVLAAGWFVLFFLGMQPIENSLVARLTPPRWRSTSYGLKFTVTFGLGAGAVWIVNAARSSAWGTPAVFAVLAGVLTCVITGVLVLTLVSRGVDMHQTG
jgi:MFS family permease